MVNDDPLAMLKLPVPLNVTLAIDCAPVMFKFATEPGALIIMLSVETGPATLVFGLQLFGLLQVLSTFPVHV